MLGPFDLKFFALLALIFVPLELLFPLHRRPTLRKHWWNDLLFLFGNVIPITFGTVFLAIIMTELARRWVPHAVVAAVQSQPLWLQAVEVIVAADIGFYLAHRAFHAVPFLWRFHAVHHSIEELDWLAAFRVHPLDQILTKSASFLPIAVFGFSDGAVFAFALIYKWHSVAIHSNSRIGLGPLKWIFATPQFHHWHHANEPAALDKNFAGQLSFLDWIGRTQHMPDAMPARYGTDTPVPTYYHQQLIAPFRRPKVAG